MVIYCLVYLVILGKWIVKNWFLDLSDSVLIMVTLSSLFGYVWKMDVKFWIS